MLITAWNPETVDLEKSYLISPYAASTTSIQVRNNDRFTANDRILVGEQGTDKAEVVTVSAISVDGSTITVGATVFDHGADDPIYKLRFDQVKFYRSTTGSSGSYSVISTQNLDVDNANLTTVYDDTSGTASYYYKTTVYHSISTVESAFSDPIAGSGYTRKQVGRIVDEILQEVSDPNEINITRTELIGYFGDVNDDLTTSVAKPYEFLKTRTTLTRTANTSYIDYPTAMWKFERMDYNFTDSTTTPTTDYTTTIENVMTPKDFRNTYSDNTISTTTVTDATPLAMTLDNNVSRFRFSAPFATTTANVFYLYFWKFFDEIDSEGDEIETPSAKIYKLYVKGMYYRKRAITESSYQATADRYFADYNIEKNRYVGLNRKDQGSQRSFHPPRS